MTTPAGRAKTAAANSARVIVVEGVIAAGKTALVEAIVRRLRAGGRPAVAVLEPVERWRETGALQRFYASPGEGAYEFQSFVYATRVIAIAEAVAAAPPETEFFVLERSPASDGVFWALLEGAAPPHAGALYAAWRHAWDLALPLDLRRAEAVYVRPSLAQCMRRLAARAREGETPAAGATGDTAESGGAEDGEDGGAPPRGGVTLEYETRLRRAHDEFMGLPLGPGFEGEAPPPVGRAPYARVHLIPEALADLDFREGADACDEVVAEVLRQLGVAAA
jgi:deoxyadenosine/deoxycytidine kinase